MTREQDFLHHSQRRWLGVASLYWPPYRFRHSDGDERLAVQVLAANDVESEYMMDMWHAGREASPYTAAELISFIDDVFAKHGRCSEGVLILPSVWESTERLYQSEITRERVEGIYLAGIRIPEMDAGQRYEVASHVQALGLELAWEEDQIPNLDALIDH